MIWFGFQCWKHLTVTVLPEPWFKKTLIEAKPCRGFVGLEEFQSCLLGWDETPVGSVVFSAAEL